MFWFFVLGGFFLLLHPAKMNIDTAGTKWQPRVTNEENISDTSAALQQVC